MSIEHVSVPRIRCGHTEERSGRCGARIYGDDTLLSDDNVRALARERGWSTDPDDRCPSHR